MLIIPLMGAGVFICLQSESSTTAVLLLIYNYFLFKVAAPWTAFAISMAPLAMVIAPAPAPTPVAHITVPMATVATPLTVIPCN